MRPRVFPAEDTPAASVDALAQEASMRPRVFPAEDAADDAQALGYLTLQ